jgi:3',5'-cyclic AMP phosphodiesterase CpdA
MIVNRQSCRLLLLLLGFVMGMSPASSAYSQEGGTRLAASDASRPLLSFAVLSDIHIRAGDPESAFRLAKALDDWDKIRPGRRLTVINGDLTDGSPQDYQVLKETLKPYAGQGNSRFHFTMGNHDFYQLWKHRKNGSLDTSGLNPQWSSAREVALFTKAFGYGRPYHDAWIQGFHFIFLSGEAYRDLYPAAAEDAYLSQAQLLWLDEKLKEEPPDEDGNGPTDGFRRPVFLFLHQPLPGTLEGSGRGRGVVQYGQLRSILESRPGCILFSGHTHWNWGTTRQIWDGPFLAAGSSSVRQVLEADDRPSPALSQSLAVDVYADRVEIRGREHSTRRWIGMPYIKGY